MSYSYKKTLEHFAARGIIVLPAMLEIERAAIRAGLSADQARELLTDALLMQSVNRLAEHSARHSKTRAVVQP